MKKEDEKYRCLECGARFTSYSEALRHINNEIDEQQKDKENLK